MRVLVTLTFFFLELLRIKCCKNLKWSYCYLDNPIANSDFDLKLFITIVPETKMKFCSLRVIAFDRVRDKLPGEMEDEPKMGTYFLNSMYHLPHI